MNTDKSTVSYEGFEQGPIRPPSEAHSLLIRVTRNCPWNKCLFCPVYKGTRFSMRPKEHVIKDIDTVHKYITLLKEELSDTTNISQSNITQSNITQSAVSSVSKRIASGEHFALQTAINWMMSGMHSIFIQDADSLVIKPADMISILQHIRKRFPEVERITSYGRSHTIARIDDTFLREMADAGLNRIHIGLESGSDIVLKRIRKGVTKAIHIKAGLKVKNAGIELSEYVMPGLGGQELSDFHALETADALNQINPDFIRLRTLAIPNRLDLHKECEEGTFKKCTDLMVVKEILLFLKNLEGITSVVKSDHILNLFQKLEGQLPRDKDQMMGLLENFLQLEPMQQCIYQMGRRLGIFSDFSDMNNAHKVGYIEEACRSIGAGPHNVDQVISDLMKRFV